MPVSIDEFKVCEYILRTPNCAPHQDILKAMQQGCVAFATRLQLIEALVALCTLYPHEVSKVAPGPNKRVDLTLWCPSVSSPFCRFGRVVMYVRSRHEC